MMENVHVMIDPDKLRAVKDNMISLAAAHLNDSAKENLGNREVIESVSGLSDSV